MNTGIIFLTLLSIIFQFSCKKETNQKKTNTKIENTSVLKSSRKEQKEISSLKIEKTQTDCEKFWNSIHISDSLKKQYITEIIHANELTKNNTKFLQKLMYEEDDKLGFDKVLSPIFRVSASEIGIIFMPNYKVENNQLVEISKEVALKKEADYMLENSIEHFGEIKFYPEILNNLFKKKSKPFINYYTTHKTDSTQIQDLGLYIDECLEYYDYAIDTTNISIKKDTLLFSSTMKIDLVYENDKKVDSLLKNHIQKECLDCPISTHLSKTFSRLKGTNNIFFTYADTFPINDKLDTPSRGLVLIKNKKEVVYLWYEEIDFFGCGCL